METFISFIVHCESTPAPVVLSVRRDGPATRLAVGGSPVRGVEWHGFSVARPFLYCRHSAWRRDAYRRDARSAGRRAVMWKFDNVPVPHIQPPLPGPKARDLLGRDARFVSPSYTRVYPLVVARGSGAVIEDVDGNRFLDLTAGIAVTAAGHCHPEVVAAIQDQADNLLHMSGTDFYYAPQIDLAQRLAETAPGPSSKRALFTTSGAEALAA